MTPKLTYAQFIFEGVGSVIFHLDTGLVDVATFNRKIFCIDNRKRAYKPCATHAMELIRRSLPRETRPKVKPSNFAKRRAKEAKPELKIVTH